MKNFLALLISILCLHGLSAQDSGYGNNIIGLTPLGGYAASNVDDTYFGFFYERLVSDHVGLKVPVHLGLNNDLIQTGLSFKLYPGGHQGVFKYAISPTVLYSKGHDGNGRGSSLSFPPYYDESRDPIEYTQLGFMVLNSLNWCIGESFYCSGEIGFGLNYLNEPERGEAQNDTRLNGIIGFDLGYRF